MQLDFIEENNVVAAQCCFHCRYCVQTQDKSYVCVHPKLVLSTPKNYSVEESCETFETDVCDLFEKGS